MIISRGIWADTYLLPGLGYSFAESGSWRRLSEPSIHLNWCAIGLRYVVNITVPSKFSRSFCSVIKSDGIAMSPSKPSTVNPPFNGLIGEKGCPKFTYATCLRVCSGEVPTYKRENNGIRNGKVKGDGVFFRRNVNSLISVSWKVTLFV
jgi:hypothetical protein